MGAMGAMGAVGAYGSGSWLLTLRAIALILNRPFSSAPCPSSPHQFTQQATKRFLV